jgi:hypothetical protein
MRKYKYIVGIDPSIDGTGICVYDLDSDYYSLFSYSSHNKHGNISISDEFCSLAVRRQPYGVRLKNMYQDEIERYTDIAKYNINEIMSRICWEIKNTLFVYEDYSYASFGRGLTKIAEFGGIFKHLLYLEGADKIQLISPTSVKKSLLKGNAKKEEMREACRGTKLGNILDEAEELYKGHPTKFLEDIVDAFAIVRASLRS